MYDELVLQATDTSHGDAEWAPLERFVPLVLCGGFMYMHTTTLDGRVVLHASRSRIATR